MRKPLWLMAGVLLVACTTTSGGVQSGMPMPKQTYAHIQPIKVNVTQVEINNASARDDVPDDFVYSVSDQALLYLSRKFEASGYAPPQQGRLVVRIEEARAEYGHQEADQAVGRWLNVGGSDHYRIILKVVVEHQDQYGGVIYGKALSAEQKLGISEHSSIAKRESEQMAALETLFKAIDGKITDIVTHEMRLEAH